MSRIQMACASTSEEWKMRKPHGTRNKLTRLKKKLKNYSEYLNAKL